MKINEAQRKALNRLSIRTDAAHHTQLGTNIQTMRKLFDAGLVSLKHECGYEVWTINKKGRTALASGTEE